MVLTVVRGREQTDFGGRLQSCKPLFTSEERNNVGGEPLVWTLINQVREGEGGDSAQSPKQSHIPVVLWRVNLHCWISGKLWLPSPCFQEVPRPAVLCLGRGHPTEDHLGHGGVLKSSHRSCLTFRREEGGGCPTEPS